MERKEEEHEALCLRCGACCGALGDPCVHLKRDGDGRWACEVYAVRFGSRVTVSGRTFQCVPLRNVLHEDWRGKEACAYYRAFRRDPADAGKNSRS